MQNSNSDSDELLRLQIAQIEREESRRACEASLLDFTKEGWRWVEPSPFRCNWHVECICEHLEAVANRQILRLLINVPPRHMKSLGANVFFPAWVWLQNPNPDNDPTLKNATIMSETWRGPGVKFAHLSYDADLSTDHSVKCRQLIDSPWYQERWGKRFSFRKDQNLKTRYLNTASGERLSGTMHGITGYGANIIVYDDPHDIQSVESDIKRKEVLKFWTEILPNRLNPDAPGAFIVIMQRSHARDLAGYIIAHELDATLVDVSEWTPTTWRHICLPARHEKKHAHPLRTDLIRKGTDQIWTDPREEGEALWPELFPLSELDRRESTMTPYAVAGQMQQRPVAREGGMFKREWFGERQFLESTDIPPGTKWVRHWDLAATESATADYTCGLKLGRMPDGRFVVGDIIRVQKEGHEVRALIEATAALDGRYCEISLPKDPGQAGKVQAADFVRTLAGYVVHTDAESGSKEVRAEPVAAQAAHGNLCMRRAPWNEAFLDELCMFPAAPHDDQADALSGAFARFVLPIGEHSSGFMTGLN